MPEDDEVEVELFVVDELTTGLRSEDVFEEFTVWGAGFLVLWRWMLWASKAEEEGVELEEGFLVLWRWIEGAECDEDGVETLGVDLTDCFGDDDLILTDPKLDFFWPNEVREIAKQKRSIGVFMWVGLMNKINLKSRLNFFKDSGLTHNHLYDNHAKTKKKSA